MPAVIRNRLPDLTPDDWFEGYQISVTDVRQVIDWASGQPEINETQVAVIGISLGGFISAIAMGVDKRITAGIFLVAGGNSERIAWEGRKQSAKTRDNLTEVEYNEAQNHYAQYLTEVAQHGVENVTPVKKSFLTDPMTFAVYLRKRPVFMLNALWDEYIPRQATLDFWKAAGRPAIAWFPATHSTIWLWYPLIRRKIGRKIVRFLGSAFGM
jgi:cephalosporin-C deacetylase-like acetyl esterase